MKTDQLPILIGDDSELDVTLFERVFSRLGFRTESARDGAEVVAYLNGSGQFADRILHPFPQALILDLKMPRMNGFDVLSWMRENPFQAVTPTIVFSTSNEPSDIKRAYQLGANTYFRKPIGYDELTSLLGKLVDYWNIAERPSISQPELKVGRIPAMTC